jgi:hypothetical protein
MIVAAPGSTRTWAKNVGSLKGSIPRWRSIVDCRTRGLRVAGFPHPPPKPSCTFV